MAVVYEPIFAMRIHGLVGAVGWCYPRTWADYHKRSGRPRAQVLRARPKPIKRRSKQPSEDQVTQRTRIIEGVTAWAHLSGEVRQAWEDYRDKYGQPLTAPNLYTAAMVEFMRTHGEQTPSTPLLPR